MGEGREGGYHGEGKGGHHGEGEVGHCGERGGRAPWGKEGHHGGGEGGHHGDNAFYWYCLQYVAPLS